MAAEVAPATPLGPQTLGWEVNMRVRVAAILLIGLLCKACTDNEPKQRLHHHNDGPRVALAEVVGGLLRQRAYPYNAIYDDLINSLLRQQCVEIGHRVIDVSAFNDARFCDVRFVWCDRATMLSGESLSFQEGVWSQVPPRN